MTKTICKTIKTTGSKPATKSSSPATASIRISANIRPLQDCLDTTDVQKDIKWLADDIKVHGQLLPIVTSGKGAIKEILDGARRLKACTLAGVKPTFIDVNALVGKTTNSIMNLAVWDALNGAGRRHLTTNERCLLALKISEGQKPGSNQYSRCADGLAPITQRAAAERCGVSQDSMVRVRDVLDLGKEMGEGKETWQRLKEGGSIKHLTRELEAKKNQQKVVTVRKKNGGAAQTFKELIEAGLNFGVVYADPPWNYGRAKSTNAGAPHHHYPVMTLNEIKGMQVGKIAAADSVCWLWVPNSLLDKGIEVLKAWGFEYLTSMVWVKNKSMVTKGAIQPRHETLLIGKRGQGSLFEGHALSTVYAAPRTAHSRKPEHFATLIERLYPTGGWIELFGRMPRKGWIVWGNQANGKGVPVVVAPAAPKGKKVLSKKQVAA
jgi:N6-adenosine-specific RNA methylase IME4